MKKFYLILIALLVFGMMAFSTVNVIIDEGHSDQYAQSKLTDMVKNLESSGYNIIFSTSEITPQLLSQGKILLLANPKSLSDSEINAIVNFVQDGGGIFLTAESNYKKAGHFDVLNKLLGSLNAGFVFNPDEVEDGSSNYGDVWEVKISDFPQTPFNIVNGISVIKFYSGCSLAAPGNNPLQSGNGVYIIAQTSPMAKQADTDSQTYSYWQPPFPVGAAQIIGKGRLVGFGTAIYSNYDWTTKGYDNAQFTLNILAWLSGK
ncbi:MAG: DUF4350 domain-containing protein [Athalassotoga sp.]|uniref:DUF4350 domain-containing protein n=1 Tax=Athalassotoga sp. TaxID=2022597 RepID=UPI003D07CA21